MTTSDPKEFSTLIDQAETQVSQQASKHAGQTPSLGMPPWAVPVLLATVIAITGSSLWSLLAPVSTQQVKHDLESAVDQARTVIDASRAKDGELPETLPNAALASVVRYEPDAGGYRLIASMMGVRVTLERDGKKSMETGVEQ